MSACDDFDRPSDNDHTDTVQVRIFAFGNHVDTLSVDEGEVIDLPEYVYEGHSFEGLYFDSGFVEAFDASIPVDSDLDLYARFEPKSYTITFETFEGSDIAPVELEYLTPLGNLEAPERESYVFTGWYLDADLTEPVPYVSMPAYDLVLYAAYEDESTYEPPETPVSFLDETPDSDIASPEAFAMYLDYILFNRIEEAEFTLLFAFDDVQAVFSDAMQAKQIQSNASISYSFDPNVRTIAMTLEYGEEAVEAAASEPAYALIPFYYTTFSSSRDATFDDFALYDVDQTYAVETSDQLYYVMEQGYRPVFETDDTRAEAMYNAAKDVLRNIVDDSMGDVEKLRVMYQWLIENVTYDADLLDLSMTDAEGVHRYNGFFLEGVFIDGRAVCDGYAKALLVMARLEGIETVRVVGYSRDEIPIAHAWNKVNIDGIWYNIDATSGNTILGAEQEMFSHAFFMVDDATIDARYEATTHLELEANTFYDHYAALTFTYDGATFTRHVDSQEALNAAFNYYAENDLHGQTFDILYMIDDVDFDTALQNAVNAASLPVTYVRIDNTLIFWTID